MSSSRRRVAILLFVPLLAPAYFTYDAASSLYAARRLVQRADSLAGDHFPGQSARDHAVERWAKKRAKRGASAAPAECRSFFETGPLVSPGRVEPLAVPAEGEVFSTSDTRRDEKTPETIFFLSTYRNFPPPLTDESLCAVEAATRMYPSHRIDIWTPHPDDLAERLLSTLTPIPSPGPDPVLLLAAWQRRLPPDHFLARIRIRPLADDPALLAGTPLADWYDSGRYNQSLWIEQNLGNAARLSILWHEGGTYQDLDILAINPATAQGSMKRVLAMQDRSLFYVNNAVITVPPKDPLIWAAMEEFNATFNGDVWGWNGPHMISRTLQKRCPSLASHHDIHHPGDETVVASTDADSAAICSDLAILEPPRFYPIDLWACRDVFPRPAIPDSCGLLAALKRETLGLHLFHHHIDEFVNEWKDGTVYREIVARSCPSVAWWRERQLEKEEREIEEVERAVERTVADEVEESGEKRTRRRRLVLEAQ